MSPLRTQRRPASFTLNLAPMVDVMMCLIIFFLLASELVDMRPEALALAESSAARRVEQHELGDRVVIAVRPRADEPDDAECIVRAWDGGAIADRALDIGRMEAFLSSAASRAAQRGNELRCLIRADRDVTYGDVEQVLQACARARVANVVFAAEPQVYNRRTGRSGRREE